jgi:integrase
VKVPKKPRTRETGKAFTLTEAQTILKAALAVRAPKTPMERAKRWVPWLCAYSGARAGEITQLRGCDIERRAGFHVMKLTPEAGTIKTGDMRVVPLHEHIIAQGFLEMVKAVGQGPLFYSTAGMRSAVETLPMKPRATRADIVRKDIGVWVRNLGIPTGVSPNHGWRHTFKSNAHRIPGISERTLDEICGHEPGSEGAKYIHPTVDDMAAAMKLVPRYATEVD